MIAVGYTILKPVETQEDCDKYAEMAEAVNSHNASAGSTDTIWGIEDKGDHYELVESAPAPASADDDEATPTIEERLDTQERALTDIQLALCSLYEQAEGGEAE